MDATAQHRLDSQPDHRTQSFTHPALKHWLCGMGVSRVGVVEDLHMPQPPESSAALPLLARQGVGHDALRCLWQVCQLLRLPIWQARLAGCSGHWQRLEGRGSNPGHALRCRQCAGRLHDCLHIQQLLRRYGDRNRLRRRSFQVGVRQSAGVAAVG